MFLHTLGPRMRRDLTQILQGNLLNTGPVILNWTELPPGAPDFDANVEAEVPDVIPHTLTVPGLIHYVSARTSQVQFAEIQVGDAIVTFDSDVVLDGRQSLTFTLPDGITYVQASTGEDITRYWDVCVGGQQLSRTVALRPK